MSHWTRMFIWLSSSLSFEKKNFPIISSSSILRVIWIDIVRENSELIVNQELLSLYDQFPEIKRFLTDFYNSILKESWREQQLLVRFPPKVCFHPISSTKHSGSFSTQSIFFVRIEREWFWVNTKQREQN